MRRAGLMAAAAMMMTAGMWAQAPAPAPAGSSEIETALLAAPAQMREGATVIKWKPDYTYDTIRKGTNRLVCFDTSGLPGQQPFSVECSSVANLERIAQNLRFEAEPDRAKRQALIDAAEKNGTRAKPEYGSIWFGLHGKDRESARLHKTVALPGATAQSTGLPDNGRQGGAWIMDAGTSAAHLMVPGD